MAVVGSCLLLLGTFLAITAVATAVTAEPETPAPQEQLKALEGFSSTTYDAPLAPASELPSTLLDRELLAKAGSDECFNGIGVPYGGTVPLCEYGMPKVNQAYVWGLAKSPEELWFGTAPNTHCLVYGSFLGITTPVQTESYVCEFGESQLSPPLPAAGGDWRPPDLFRYHVPSRTLTEVTPADPRIHVTGGIRSAGTLDDVVLLAGPNLLRGINLFAFDTQTGAYLGSANVPEYNNIRKWLVVDGVLYTGVRSTATGEGHVLRWTGSAAAPFQFEVVGNLGSEATELALHEGRLFVTTWPNLRGDIPVVAGLWMSPPIPEGGLTSTHAVGWEVVWQATDYEPDPVTAATYGGGALHSFDGYLYWGTMHVPFVATFAHFNVYGAPGGATQAVAAILGTHRAISIFRGQDFAASQEIELLYGAQRLLTYGPSAIPGVWTWSLQPNKMGAAPMWGAAGFDNYYNNYTWTMAGYDGQLYVGTMDYSYLLEEGLPWIFEYLGLPPNTPVPLPEATHGADLYRFPSAASPALAESLNGVDNPSSYGVRTMVSDDALYLGMANPMNLLTDPLDDQPEGGWELIRLWQPNYIEVCKEDTEGDPIAGWDMTLTGPESAAAVTGAHGCLTFTVNTLGTYTVEEELREGWTPQNDTSAEFAVVSGGGPYQYTFVNFQNASIQACKEDMEGDPIAGWGMTLTGPENAVEVTGADGCVTFTVTTSGAYTVEEELREGWRPQGDTSVEFAVMSGDGPYQHTFVNLEIAGVIYLPIVLR
jgi:hypothetical protein